MAQSSTIEWTESTWNPVTGCSKVSPGCLHCYAERMALRLKAMGNENYRNGFAVTCHDHLIEKPMEWKKPQLIFVNSMSDLFHEEVPLEFILKVFHTMNRAHWHIFQVLTKRSERLMELSYILPWAKNIWMGVSVEDQSVVSRIEHLKQTHSDVKFISFEPLIGPITQVNLASIDWAIVGGESGPGARPMEKEWVLRIRDLCQESQVPFFFKQWGGVNKKKWGRMLEGRTWDQMPRNTFQVNMVR